MAVSILAGLGHEVVASSGKASAADWLKGLGASAVIDRAELTETPEAAHAGDLRRRGRLRRWRHPRRGRGPAGSGRAVAASGNTGGAKLDTTVLPFILRGVSLLGIDSATTPIARRRMVWDRIAGDLRPHGLDAIRRDIALADVEAALDEIAVGGVQGRYLVDTTGSRPPAATPPGRRGP